MLTVFDKNISNYNTRITDYRTHILQTVLLKLQKNSIPIHHDIIHRFRLFPPILVGDAILLCKFRRQF